MYSLRPHIDCEEYGRKDLYIEDRWPRQARVSAGGRSDIQTATEFALSLAKNNGLGRDKLFHAHHPSTECGGFRTGITSAEEQVKEWMEEAEQLALATINEHFKAFTGIVEALIENGSLRSGEVHDLFHRKASEEPTTSKSKADPAFCG